MAIYYKPVKRGKPGTTLKNQQRLYPSVITNHTITPKEFVKQFAETIKRSSTDVVFFIYALEEYLTEQIKAGNIIQTGILGTFYPVIQGGANGKDARPVIRYRPSKEMKDEIKRAELINKT
ncbi:MAG: hypothetical protein JXJ22_16015 [Bacteroidales bacterium]|nr:hypothetical protein [Bacteroidales bacterium]